MTESQSTDAPAARELSFERILDVPREAVWRCWTEPDLMTRWFTPAPWKTVAADLDLRPGGRSNVTMQSPEGELYPNAGVYLDVVPGRRLTFTDAFVEGWRPSGKAFMVGTIELEDAGPGKTRYRATVRHWSAEDCKQHEAMGFHAGWNAAADQLVEVAKTL
ncbi:MAG: SRPBCC family protein [Planctomycetota bacterium]